MTTYHEMYLKLASATADAIEDLQATTKKLILAQQEAEDILLNRGDGADQEATITLLRPEDAAEQCEEMQQTANLC
ncbi:MAG: hypothetical protein FWC62_03875 [Firmicutes bacterium]|nr:hypothetical protein [Bacillota bacterium]